MRSRPEQIYGLLLTLIAAGCVAIPASTDLPSAVPIVRPTVLAPATAFSFPSEAPSRSPAATRSPGPTPNPTLALPVDANIDGALARCPTTEEVAFVDSRLKISFFDDVTAPKLVCHARDGSAKLTRLQERAYQAVLTLRRIPFDAPLPWTERSLFGWFTHAVHGVVFWSAPEDSYCCNGRDIVVRTVADSGFLLDDRWRDNNPEGDGLVTLVTLLVHEARHGEGYVHDCNASEDQSAGDVDDQTLDEMGAWAVQYWLMRWIAEHSPGNYMTASDGDPNRYRSDAAESAEFVLQHRICQPPQ